jgi:uncharacterized protein
MVDPLPRTEEVEAIIAEMVRRIVAAFDPVQVILFGSRARGDARPDSDIDLLVVLPSVTDRHRARVAIRRVLADLPWAKDILVATPDDLAAVDAARWDVLHFASHEGKALYERSRAA